MDNGLSSPQAAWVVAVSARQVPRKRVPPPPVPLPRPPAKAATWHLSGWMGFQNAWMCTPMQWATTYPCVDTSTHCGQQATHTHMHAHPHATCPTLGLCIPNLVVAPTGLPRRLPLLRGRGTARTGGKLVAGRWGTLWGEWRERERMTGLGGLHFPGNCLLSTHPAAIFSFLAPWQGPSSCIFCSDLPLCMEVLLVMSVLNEV